MQFLTVTHAKEMLKEGRATLLDTSFETGLSGTGRLHDLFIKIEGMTPGEYKNGGEHLSIQYSFAATPFGKIIIASTPKGICYTAFTEDDYNALVDLQHHFPKATINATHNEMQKKALHIFTHDWNKIDQIKLHLKGTDFQLKVWEALLKIPMGDLSTYGSIAASIQKPNASRAVGTAIGNNPIAFLIPCHRVIQSTGTFGGYMWGPTRKAAIIGWEAAKINSNHGSF